MFPPTADHVMKVSIHAPGITHRNPQTGRSEPITRHHHLAAATEASASALEASHGNVTAEAAAAVRSCLEHVIPGLAKRTFDSTRLCWYNDTIDSNFMVDYHPTRPKIVLHTGGSGHAFKFLPVLGDLLVQRLEGKLPPEQADAFSATRKREAVNRGDPARRKALETAPMATDKELKGR